MPILHTVGEGRDRPPRLHYAGKVAVKRAIATARHAGIDVGALELGGDGTIRVIALTAVPLMPELARAA